MYSKATYVKPYIRKFIRVLGINNVGTLNKPKMNVIYAILANNGIKPIDKNQYGVPLYQYRDLDGLNDLSIIAGFNKWKDDMLRKDVEISMRDNDKVKKASGYRVDKKQPDTQTQIQFDDENDDRLYESLFSKKVFFTEQQVKAIQESEQPETKKAFFTEEQINYIKDKLNEGAWGVKPEQSDTYLDWSHELGEPIIKILSDKLSKYVKEPKGNDGNIYYWLGLMLDMLKVRAFDESWLYCSYDKGDAGNKYKMIRDLFETANKGYDYLLTDTASENRQGWKDFHEYEAYLKKMHKEFKMLEDYYNMDKDDPEGADKLIKEVKNFVNPNKVLLIKKYLDDNFVRASMPIIGDDGYPKNVHIVGMKGADGEVARNMTAKQLFYLLQDKFKGIYGDKAKRNALIKQTMIDWYNKKISNEGLLSKNTY